MRRGPLLVLVLFACITLLFFFPVLRGNIPFPGDLLIGEYTPYNSYQYQGYAPGSYPNKGQNFDVIRLIYPAKFFSINQLKNGQFPLWNPHIFSGNPHIASLQSGTFYPFNLLFFALPFIIAWTLYILIQPFLAGLFTFIFLRELKLSRLASIFGGIVFAFSSYFTVWVEYGNLNHTFLWLPLILYFILSILKSPRLYKYIILIFLLSFTILAGYIQSALYVFAFSFVFLLFCLFVGKVKDKVLIATVFLSFFIPLAISAVQLLPLVELFFQSTRSEFSAEAFIKLLIPYYHFVTFFVPDFFGNPATRNYYLTGTYIERVSYVGIIPAFFAFYAIWVRGNRWVWFFLASAIVIFLLVFDTFVSRLLYSFYLPPVISTGVPSRIMFLFAFPLSALAAIGFNSFESSVNTRKVIKNAIVFGGIFLCMWAYAYFGFRLLSPEVSDVSIAVTKRNLIIPTGILLGGLAGIVLYLFIKKWRIVLLICFILITIVELFYFFRKIVPFAPPDTIYPPTNVMINLQKIQEHNRSWGYGSGRIDTNLQIMEDTYGVEGYDALHVKRYAELLSLSEGGSISSTLARSESELPRGFGNDDLTQNSYRKRIMDILSVKYVLHKVDENPDVPHELTFPTEDYRLVWNDDTWQIYENVDSLPRVYLVGDVVVESNDEKIANTLLNTDFDIRNSAIVEKEIPDGISKDSSASATIASYTPNKVLVRTNSQEDMLLVVTDTFFDGWEARVDGRSSEILRTNYALRGVVVPSGNHVVEFVYKPSSFTVGSSITAISSITLIGALVVSLFVKRRRRKV